MEIKPWRVLSRRVLLERPPWLAVGEQDVELPDGTVLEGFNWIETRPFAIVIPLLEGDRMILVRSFKLGVGAASLSLPAGYLEAGEAPLAGASSSRRPATRPASGSRSVATSSMATTDPARCTRSSPRARTR